MKRILKNIIAVFLGLFVSLLIAEIVLHLYNPFKSRVRDGRIILPVNVTMEYDNNSFPGLEKHIIHHINSLGFRGPELPADTSVYKIFCVGGSTTECFYLSDGKDWPALLMGRLKNDGHNVWINNAGLDGHSCWGHEVLLRDYLLRYKPDMIVFLVGCNDMASTGINQFERAQIPKRFRMLEYSEIFNIIQNFRMVQHARKSGMRHMQVDFIHQNSADTTGWNSGKSKWFEGLDEGLKSYAARLRKLGAMCLKNGSIPVFVTQPTILGNAIDPVTKRFLGNLEFQGESGMHYEFVLEKYNMVLKQVCSTSGWLCIDAARALEKSSENYYDYVHYTLRGSNKMAKIIEDGIVQANIIP